MRIAVVEDNEALAKGIAYHLRDAGHAVDLLNNGEDADVLLRQEGADLVILDINLPGISGLDVLARLRTRSDQTPVILLTARGATADRVDGLDAGADDYLVKPFEMAELEARVRALARRRETLTSMVETVGDLEFDAGSRQLFAAGHAIELPRREMAVFECMFERRGRLVSKAALLDHLYGVGSDVEEKVIEVYVSRLRKRLAPYNIKIKVARGLGYLLEFGEG